MKQVTILFFSLLSTFCPVSLAQGPVWFIDQSCHTGPQGSVTPFVQRGMNGAFRLAQSALTVAQDAANDPNKQRLVDRLFGTDNYDKNAPRDEVARIFTNILTFTTEVQNANGLEDGRDDIHVYCDESRLEQSPRDPNLRFDTDSEEDIKPDSSVNCDSAIAYTYPANKFNQIQICPWFLNYALSEDDEKIFQEAVSDGLLDRFIRNAKATFFKTLFTPIDAVAAFDKVLLHEITHTRAGFRTVDLGGGFNGYGWKNCRRIADQNSRDDANNPTKNADTLALFGSASELLLRTTPRFVDDAGKITGTAPTKRSFDSQFDRAGSGLGLGTANATDAVDIDALLVRAAVNIGKEGREWRLEDRVGRRHA